MKKIFVSVILFLTMMSSVCFAIDKNDFSLGGIYLNMSQDEITKMYGQPTSRPGGWAQLVSDCIKYGDAVEIGLLGKKVRYVVVTANNGWKTFAGVHVGMSIDDVIKIYGGNYKTESKSVRFDYQKQHLYTNLNGTAYIWSRVSENFSYNEGDTKYRISVVVNNNKVNAIVLDQITPEY
ncbi:MAG: hypothetical protein IK062_05630 [Selenomonadaceae bacterium]|nr:hypothetical protein [Selenomonadaceae bacterium]